MLNFLEVLMGMFLRKFCHYSYKKYKKSLKKLIIFFILKIYLKLGKFLSIAGKILLPFLTFVVDPTMNLMSKLHYDLRGVYFAMMYITII